MRLLANTNEWSIRNTWIKSGRKRSNFLPKVSPASPELPSAQSETLERKKHHQAAYFAKADKGDS